MACRGMFKAKGNDKSGVYSPGFQSSYPWKQHFTCIKETLRRLFAAAVCNGALAHIECAAPTVTASEPVPCAPLPPRATAAFVTCKLGHLCGHSLGNAHMTRCAQVLLGVAGFGLARQQGTLLDSHSAVPSTGLLGCNTSQTSFSKLSGLVLGMGGQCSLAVTGVARCAPWPWLSASRRTLR